MTITAQGQALRCDYAGCKNAGTVEIDAWAYCPNHAGRQHLDAAPTPTPRPRPTAVSDARPKVDLATVTTEQQTHGIALAGPSPLGLLLEQASGHTVARVRTLAGRIETQLAQLRALIAEHAADEQRRKTEAEAKEKARAEVARLEQQLRDAKAKLAGKTTRSVAKPDVRLAPQECTKGCGKTCIGSQGRAAHERHCTGPA